MSRRMAMALCVVALVIGVILAVVPFGWACAAGPGGEGSCGPITGAPVAVPIVLISVVVLVVLVSRRPRA